MKQYFNYLVKWLKNEVKKANCKGVIVGLSGGVDSSVVAAIAKKAFPKHSMGVYMPVGNMGQDLKDAEDVADFLKIETTLVDLTEPFKAMEKAMPIKTKLAVANMKPRLRMTALYGLAQENGYLVLGTDNQAEWMLGYFTKYGDGGADLLPIIHLTKGEVMQMARDLKMPKNIYTKAPTAALWEGQTDEEELGFSYDEVDKFLTHQKIDADVKEKIQHQIKITEHKRKALPIPNKPDIEELKAVAKELVGDFKSLFKKK